MSVPDHIANGRYKLERELGRGARGAVYEGIDTTLNRPVAIKILTRSDKNSALRFQTEARAAGRLRHANTISILDFGETESGDLYLVMELVDGENLEDLLEREGSLPPPVVIEIFARVLSGLSHAHEKGLIHRDIKPSNIMLQRVGEDYWPKLSDFGLSRIMNEQQGITQTGVTVGSPNFVSPELAQGQPADARSDIYSLGCAMFQVLTGRGPFDEEQAMTTILKHISEPAPALKDVSDLYEYSVELERIIATCLAKDPDKRFQSAKELQAELLELRSPSTKESKGHVEADEEPLPKKPEAPVLRKVSPTWVVFAAGIILVAAVAAWFAFHSIGEISDTVIVPPKVEGVFEDPGHTLGNENTEEMVKVTGAPASVPGQAFLHPSFSANSQVIYSADEAHAVPKECRMVTLDVASDACIKPLAQTEVTYVDASRLKVTDHAIDELSNIKSLERLVLATAHGFTDESLKSLAKLPNLKGLCLDNTRVTDRGLKYLTKCKSLKTVQLNRCHAITDEGLRALSEIPRLTSLDLGDTSITVNGFLHLTKCKNLSSIYLNTSQVTDEGVRNLAQIKLRAIHLGGCRRITPAVIESLVKMKQLERIDLRGLYVDDEFARRLSTLPNLQRLDLRHTRVSNKSLEYLSRTKKLILLAVGATAIDENGIGQLKNFKALECVDLSGLGVTDSVLDKLAGTKLKMILLYQNSGTASGIGRFMKECKTLKVIGISTAQFFSVAQAMSSKGETTEVQPMPEECYRLFDIELPLNLSDEAFSPPAK